MKNTLKATSMIAAIYLFTGYQELSAQAANSSDIDHLISI